GEANPGYEGVKDTSVYTNIRFKPWGTHSATQVERTEGDYFKIEYIAFFKTKAEAEAYSTAKYDFKVKNQHLAAFDLNITSTYFESSIVSNDDGLPYLRFTPTCTPGVAAPESAAIQLNTPNIAGEDINTCKYFLLCYRTNIKNSNTIDFNLGVDYGTGSARLWGPKLSFTSSDEFKTLLVDLSALGYTGGGEGYYAPDEGQTIWSLVNDVTYIRIKPYNRKVSLEGEYFDVLYFGLFDSVEQAQAYVPTLPESSNYRGDATGDLLVDPADEITFARMLTDPELTYSNETEHLDIDRDGVISAADQVILARHIAGWKKNQSLYTSYVDAEKYVAELNEKFESRKNEILNTESEWSVKAGGDVFYISPSGNDSNDGLSEDTPWKTTANIKASKISSGDVVLFERGGVWREKFTAVSGVTYSAYGTGPKPALYGSVDGANESDWSEVYDNVWKFTPRTFKIASEDVGCIIFNHGEAYGARVLTNANGNMVSVGTDGITSNGLEQWYRKSCSFADDTTL
ncbi:MAG: hypothetical protein IJ391_01465, partial [Clostridia bacterium]|nr:hypothetical protein [Clostridia bacterium]